VLGRWWLVADRDASNASDEQAAMWPGAGCWRKLIDAGNIKQAAGVVSAVTAEKPRGITVKEQLQRDRDAGCRRVLLPHLLRRRAVKLADEHVRG
jgi:hypothetical protein